MVRGLVEKEWGPWAWQLENLPRLSFIVNRNTGNGNGLSALFFLSGWPYSARFKTMRYVSSGSSGWRKVATCWKPAFS